VEERAVLKNERQYRIAKAQAEELEEAFTNLTHSKAASHLAGDKRHERLLQEQERYLRARLDGIHRDLEEYEQIRSGKRGEQILRQLGEIQELPRSLIEARIASGLTQKELAQRLGLKAQQVQHYEATDYASASLSRVLEIAKVLGTCSS